MQNFKNHRRFYPAHHFFLTPLLIGLLVWSIVHCTKHGFTFPNIYFVLVSFILLFMTLMSRIYALKNQNRIIRLESRYRYFELTGKSFSEKEKELKLGQIIALRFAGDDELVSLTERAISEKLTPNEIKKEIKNWVGDYHRI